MKRVIIFQVYSGLTEKFKAMKNCFVHIFLKLKRLNLFEIFDLKIIKFTFNKVANTNYTSKEFW